MLEVKWNPVRKVIGYNSTEVLVIPAPLHVATPTKAPDMLLGRRPKDLYGGVVDFTNFLVDDHTNVRQWTWMKCYYGMGMSIVDTFPHFQQVVGGCWATLRVPLHYPVICPGPVLPIPFWIVDLEVLRCSEFCCAHTQNNKRHCFRLLFDRNQL